MGMADVLSFGFGHHDAHESEAARCMTMAGTVVVRPPAAATAKAATTG
jgi:hypothetical protein